MTNPNQNRAGWQNAHDLAVRSISIVRGSKPVSKSWPFKAASSGASLRATSEAAAQRPPLGNYGGYISGENKRG